MPELPEVETVCQGLRPYLIAQHLIHVECHRPDLRLPLPPSFTSVLEQPILDISRRGKYMLWHCANDHVLLLHLGMSGRILVNADKSQHDHVIFTTNEGHRLTFRDPRRFGLILITHINELSHHPLLAHLGIEPLSEALTTEWLLERAQRSSCPLKTFLLNQKIIVGVGNIYACEALFRARLHPERSAHTLTASECRTLVYSIKETLKAAIAEGGTTLKDYRQPSGTLGYFQHTLLVYNRAGNACPRCGITSPLKRIFQAGRSTFYCSYCQK